MAVASFRRFLAGRSRSLCDYGEKKQEIIDDEREIHQSRIPWLFDKLARQIYDIEKFADLWVNKSRLRMPDSLSYGLPQVPSPNGIHGSVAY